MNFQDHILESECKNIAAGCLFCGKGISIFREGVFDTRFGIEGSFNISMCASCGLIQLSPSPSYKELKRLYETYYNFDGEKGTVYTGLREYFFASAFYRFWLAIDGDISFHGIKGSGRLLDVGCNEGRGLQIYEQNGFDAEGLELNERAAAEARKAGFTVYSDLLEEFQPENLYDVVVLSNVLEHSLDPKKMLFHARRILKPGGQIWISCPNSQSWFRSLFSRFWINWHIPFHIVHFSSQTLARILRQSGFEVVCSRQTTPALWVAHSLIACLFAKPGQPTKQLRNPFLVAALMLLIRTLFFPVLWLGNFLGHGDCLVIVAAKV